MTIELWKSFIFEENSSSFVHDIGSSIGSRKRPRKYVAETCYYIMYFGKTFDDGMLSFCRMCSRFFFVSSLSLGLSPTCGNVHPHARTHARTYSLFLCICFHKYTFEALSLSPSHVCLFCHFSSLLFHSSVRRVYTFICNSRAAARLYVHGSVFIHNK